LNEPVRDHSVFLWWSWTDIVSAPERPITINDMIGDRSYEAIWWCVTWYHASGANECAPNQYTGSVDYNDGTSHGAAEVIEFTYDQVTHLDNPEQSWYIFSWWTITWMSGWVEHIIGTLPVTWDTVDLTKATEFMNLSTEQWMTDIKFTAIWTPRNDTEYVIYHYYRDINATTYSLSWTDHLTGTTDTDVVFAEKLQNYSWFTYTGWFVNITSTPTAGLPTDPKVTTGNIHKDGSLKIYLYYDRNRYDVNLSGDAHVATLTGAGTYDFQADVTVDMTAKTWYHFRIWEKSDENRTLH
jgi:hypothetical protein